MKGAVQLVYKPTISGAGIHILAICTSRKAAEMAQSRVAKAEKRNHAGPAGTTRYYDKPLSNPYTVEIQIAKVLVDRIYPEGLDERKLEEFDGNAEETEAIR